MNTTVLVLVPALVMIALIGFVVFQIAKTLSSKDGSQKTSGSMSQSNSRISPQKMQNGPRPQRNRAFGITAIILFFVTIILVLIAQEAEREVGVV